MILLSILLPAVSFFMQGRIIAAIIALILHVIACFTFIFFGIGFVIWLVLAIWAVSSYNNHKSEKRMKEMMNATTNKS